MAQEADEAIGRLEQIDGVPGRRRVDDHEVPLAARVQLVETFDRHVLLGARQRPRDRPVDRVLQDRLGLLGVGSLFVDEAIEGRGRIQHHRPQLAIAGDSRNVQHPMRGIGGHAGIESERIGEPTSRIHGHHDDASPGPSRSDAERCCGGGLADTAGTAGDEQARRGDLGGERLGGLGRDRLGRHGRLGRHLPDPEVPDPEVLVNGASRASASTPR